MNTKNFFKEKRTWSYYKDALLERYLKIYFQKILTSKYNTVYIDGFAGKGRFDDGTDGSPVIVSKIIQDAKLKTHGQGQIASYFIEYKYARELEKHIDPQCVVSGDYKVELPKIIDTLKNSNVFLYADPFGIKHLKFDVFSKLKSNNINSAEMLLNFNSFGFLREGCRLLKIKQTEITDVYDADEDIKDNVNSIDNMNCIANGEYWIELLNDYKLKVCDMKEIETLFVEKYTMQLRKIFKFVVNIPIRTGENNIPKYRMIYGTNYIDGILLMSDIMFKCDKEIQLSNNGNQHSLFDYMDRFNCIDDILHCLPHNFLGIKELCLKIYNEIGVKYSHEEIQDSLKQLEKRGQIVVRRTPSTTKTGKKVKALSIMNKEYVIEVRSIE